MYTTHYILIVLTLEITMQFRNMFMNWSVINNLISVCINEYHTHQPIFYLSFHLYVFILSLRIHLHNLI